MRQKYKRVMRIKLIKISFADQSPIVGYSQAGRTGIEPILISP